MSLGSSEIFVIVILALLLFGPDKLPELARQAARIFRDVRRAADEVKSQFNLLGDEEEDEPRRPLASMRDKINENRDNNNREDENATSSTRSDEADDPYAHRYGDEINADDTHIINDENGASPADNNWNDARNCEEDRAKDLVNNSSKLESVNSGESFSPMTTQEGQLFGVAPATPDASAETPRDTQSELELRVTPTTSVARTSPPNRVRQDEEESSA